MASLEIDDKENEDLCFDGEGEESNKFDLCLVGKLLSKCVKVNVDASVFEGDESFFLGMILRDYKGVSIEGKNLRLPKSGLVFEAKAVGVRKALSWMENKEIHHNFIETDTDSLTTVQALKRSIDNQPEAGHDMSYKVADHVFE